MHAGGNNWQWSWVTFRFKRNWNWELNCLNYRSYPESIFQCEDWGGSEVCKHCENIFFDVDNWLCVCVFLFGIKSMVVSHFTSKETLKWAGCTWLTDDIENECTDMYGVRGRWMGPSVSPVVTLGQCRHHRHHTTTPQGHHHVTISVTPLTTGSFCSCSK